MQVDLVEIENFQSICEAKVNLAGQGLVAIVGENHDDSSTVSNGAGKSSLADALFWGYYGETARGISGDEVVNETAGAGCKVAVTSSDGDDVWRVTRYRKYPKLKNALTVEQMVAGAWVDRTKGTTTLTQAFIESVVVGASKSVFIAAVYSGQEKMPDIPSFTDKQLKEIVEEAAGTDVLAETATLARERLNTAKTEMADAQVKIDRAGAIIGRQKDAIEDAKRRTETWLAGRDSIIADAKRAVARAKKGVTDARAAYDPTDLVELNKHIEDCEAKIRAVAAEQTKERALAVEASQARSKSERSDDLLKRYANAVRSSKEAVQRVSERIGQPCDECGKKYVAADIEEATTLAQRKFEEAGRDYLAQKPIAEADKKAADEAQTTLERHRAGMTDISSEQAKLQSLQREKDHIRGLERAIVDAEQVLSRAEESLRREETQENPLDGILIRQNEELDKLIEEQGALVKDFSAKKEAVEYAEAVWSVFAPSGVRAHILDIVTPYLNERTAHYLGSLTDGNCEAFWTTLTISKDGKSLQEKFSIGVEKIGSGQGFHRLSGGEKRKVRIACALALQDLVASRATKSIDLWLGDEIDDALDAAGLERLMNVLEEKARERGTVLVISHNDIRDYVRNTWKVIRSGNVSRIDVS